MDRSRAVEGAQAQIVGAAGFLQGGDPVHCDPGQEGVVVRVPGSDLTRDNENLPQPTRSQAPDVLALFNALTARPCQPGEAPNGQCAQIKCLLMRHGVAEAILSCSSWMTERAMACTLPSLR